MIMQNIRMISERKQRPCSRFVMQLQQTKTIRWSNQPLRDLNQMHIQRNLLCYSTSIFPFTVDEFSSNFLIKTKANVNAPTLGDRETPLHMVAGFNPLVTDPTQLQGMVRVTSRLIECGANPNAQDAKGK